MMDGYKFRFASQAGSDYTINLRPATGWSGQYKSRAMGASPVLRRERNGAILGSSLTLRLECLEDNEYAVLYTSSPYEWLAELYLNGNVLVWRGYVSPELYSAPDMAPPYDVEIIATDGLGELKRASYAQDGPMTLHDILKALLNTAQQDNLPIMWRLDYTSDGCNGSNYLTAVSLDLTSQSGRSCYDVLSDLLASMHAMIMYDGGEWLVINECDLPTDGTALTLHEGNTGNDVSLSPQALGGAWWPVGKLSDKVVSAKREVTLTTTTITRELMPDQTLTAQGGAGQMEDGTLLGGSGNSRIVQEVYVGNVYSRATKLELELEATGNGSLIVNVTGKCSDTSAPVAHRGPWTVGSVELQNGVPVMSVGEGGHWISGEPVTTNVIAITPDGDKLSMSLVLPTDEVHIYAEDDGYGGVRYSLGAMHDIETYLDTISVSVTPDAGSCKVTRMSLREVPGYRGTETTVKLANGARDAASSVDTLVSSDIDGADTGTLAILREGVPMAGGKALRKWGGSYDYVAYMGTMYARSNALPAVDKTGIINVPAGTSYIPLMWTQLGVVYMLRRYDWDIIADELTINEMVSLPVASITVESITTQYTANSSGSSNGSGSSSGGSGSPSGGSSGAMTFVGVTITPISQGSTQNEIDLDDSTTYTAKKGDVVIYGKREFVWAGEHWQELGDEQSFALKSITVTGTGYLTGGGTLEANRTIDIATSVKTKIDNGDAALTKANALETNLANNYPTKNGTGASGTWGIDISGKAASADKVANALTFNSSGAGVSSGSSFDGSAAKTISYNTVGAAKAVHSHAFSEITGKPTTLDGYGITDGASDAELSAHANNTDIHLAEGDRENIEAAIIAASDASSELAAVLEGYETTPVLKTELGKKANVSDLTAHTGNTTVHITASERSSWNAKYDKPATGIPASDMTEEVAQSLENADLALADVGALSQNFINHESDTTVHITESERTAWNAKVDASTLNSHTKNTEIHTTAAEKASWNNKAEKAALNAHISDTGVHIQEGEREAWNGKYVKPSTGIPKTDLAGDVQAEINNVNTAITTAGEAKQAVTTHTADSVIHITADERAAWNAKYTKPTTGIPEEDLDESVKADINSGVMSYEMASEANGKVSTLLGSYGYTIPDLKTELDAKADKTSLTSHTGNTTMHTTSAEKANWNTAYGLRHEHANMEALNKLTLSGGVLSIPSDVDVKIDGSLEVGGVVIDPGVAFKRTPVETSENTITLAADKYYIVSGTDELTVNLPAGFASDCVMYCFDVLVPSDNFSLILPNGVRFITGDAPAISGGSRIQATILNGMITVNEFYNVISTTN